MPLKALTYGLLLGCMLLIAQAAQAQSPTPKVFFSTPAAIVKGEPTKLVLRGSQLEKTKTLKLLGVEPEIMLVPKPGKAGVPQGFDAAKVGDQQVECELTLPATAKVETVEFMLELDSGEKASFKVPVFERSQVVDDKEPNKAFAQAQPLPVGQVARGTIHEARDVDVYRLELKAGQRVSIEVMAERLGTPLDASLMIHDERGKIVDSSDDRIGRDPECEIKLSRDGAVFIVLFDANDAGSNLHGYVLKVTAK